jgi:hypothetical protein
MRRPLALTTKKANSEWRMDAFAFHSLGCSQVRTRRKYEAALVPAWLLL